MSENFIINDTLLGTALSNIKNNNVIVKKPVVITANTTLNINQFLNVLANGLVVDGSTSIVTVTTPSAIEILEALKCNKNDYIVIPITAFVTPVPSAFGAIIQGGAGVFFPVGFVNLPILPQFTLFIVLQCYDTVIPRFILN